MLFKANQSDAPATCERLFRYVSNISKRDDNSIVSQSDLAKATFFLGLRVAERWITTNDNSSSQINCAKKSRFYCMKFQSILAQKFMFINENYLLNFFVRHSTSLRDIERAFLEETEWQTFFWRCYLFNLFAL